MYKNADIRSMFQKKPHIIDLILARRLTLLGKIPEMNIIQAPRKMIECWNKSHRKPGRPQLNVARYVYIEA